MPLTSAAALAGVGRRRRTGWRIAASSRRIAACSTWRKTVEQRTTRTLLEKVKNSLSNQFQDSSKEELFFVSNRLCEFSGWPTYPACKIAAL